MTQLKSLKFLRTLVLVFYKIEREDKRKNENLAEKQKILLMKVTLIVCYIEEEKIFAIIVYMVSLQKKFQTMILKIVLKLTIKKQIRWLRKVNTLILKLLKETYNYHSWL